MSKQSKLEGMAAIKQGQIAALGASTDVTGNLYGVVCTIKNYNDPNYDTKLRALTAAVRLLKNKGYNLPDAITFHLSSDTNNPKAPTVAYARKQNNDVGVEVFLGVNAMYSEPTPMSEGIAHKVQKYALGDYTTTVAVHELGHVLHDLQSHDFFWGDGDLPLAGADVNTAFDEISAYAATNKKEVVAEVFAAHNMGLKFSGTAVSDLYARCQGPALL